MANGVDVKNERARMCGEPYAKILYFFQIFLLSFVAQLAHDLCADVRQT